MTLRTKDVYIFYYRLKLASDNNIKLEMFVNKLELYVNGDLLDSSHDRKILSQIGLRDKTVIVAKVRGTCCQY